MKDRTILVPVDGASNIKLEALDFDTLETVKTASAESPTAQHEGLACNATGREFDWFDATIRDLPRRLRGSAAVIAPVARGASGGLVGADNTLLEAPGQRLTLAYTQPYPDAVNERFNELAGPREEFFQETGSIRDLPGSLTLLKRLVFEEMQRPGLLRQAAGFAHYGALMAGHFLGEDYLRAVREAGNEHSYWMCHTGTRDVRSRPGTPSAVSKKVESFRRLVPPQPSVCYRPLGSMPPEQAKKLKLDEPPAVLCGGHDTCLSHIPILSTFYQAYAESAGQPVIQVEAGTWTMVAQMGGLPTLPGDAFARDILIQGTVDGEPVVTARYGGGADYSFLKKMARDKGRPFETLWDFKALGKLLFAADCFALPNINPSNHGTGPFPKLRGKLVGEETFLGNGRTAYMVSNLMTAMTTALQVEAISQNPQIPIVLTAGGSKDPLFGTLLATLTARRVYAMFDRNNQSVTETTTLGAAIVGKAACLGVHPYKVNTAPLGVKYGPIEPLPGELAENLLNYRAQWLRKIKEV